MNYGYYTDGSGNVISKHGFDGNDPPRGTVNFVAVATHEELKAVAVYVDPDKLKEQADKAAIDAAIEKLAITEAKKTYTFESVKFKDK